jgi:hypothetical protein
MLLAAVRRFDQAIVTTTDRADLGDGPAAVIAVEAGTVQP